jgi:hypothetical protein
MSVPMKPDTQRGPEADIEALEQQFEEEKNRQRKKVPAKAADGPTSAIS